jgi:hypothetical protein
MGVSGYFSTVLHGKNYIVGMSIPHFGKTRDRLFIGGL